MAVMVCLCICFIQQCSPGALWDQSTSTPASELQAAAAVVLTHFICRARLCSSAMLPPWVGHPSDFVTNSVSLMELWLLTDP